MALIHASFTAWVVLVYLVIFGLSIVQYQPLNLKMDRRIDMSVELM